MQTLNQLGLALSQSALAPYRFRIEGHTDTVGTAAYNKQLSDQRAAAVADYLATNFKVDRSRLQPVGVGEEGLLVPTPDQTNEPKNRRVAVVNIGQRTRQRSRSRAVQPRAPGIPGTQKNAEPNSSPQKPPQNAPSLPQYIMRSPVL